MKIERIKIDLNTMEEKSERYRCCIILTKVLIKDGGD